MRGSLRTCRLPHSKFSYGRRVSRYVRTPSYFALSYVWGGPERTHEIIINKKRLRITTNLYNALRDFQKNILWDTYIWADAICINQDDPFERSSQIFLMREIYHRSEDVVIWLGDASAEGRKGLNFVARLQGYTYPKQEAPEPSKSSPVDIIKTVLFVLPIVTVLKLGFWSLEWITVLLNSSMADAQARMIVEQQGDLSLHQDTIEALMSWEPKKEHWDKMKDTDFKQISEWIDTYLIENSDWFSRMWVVQEVVAAESAAILFAGASIRLENFLKCCCYLHYHLDAPLRNIRKLMVLQKIRQGWNKKLRHPLRDLIREFRYRKATDPRDKIFSLLGLMGDKMNRFLQPDYTKSVSEVYANATFHFITQAESLDPICGWQRVGRQAELPTWVPDYSLDQEHAATPLVSIDGTKNMFEAFVNGKEPIDDASALTTAFELNWRQLVTQGICLDLVALLSDPVPTDCPFEGIEKTWMKTILEAGDLLPSLNEEAKIHLRAISLVVHKFNETWDAIDKILKRVSDQDQVTEGTDLAPIPEIISENDAFGVLNSIDETNHQIKPQETKPLNVEGPDTVYSTAEESKIEAPKTEERTTASKAYPFPDLYIIDAYIHSLFSGRFSTKERLTKENITLIFTFDIPQALDDLKAQELQNLMDMCTPFINGMSGQRIAITKNGSISALPEEAKEGDMVCVLSGCSVPVVLRKMEGVENRYEFVGECYLHGFMDGEAKAMHAEDDLTLSEFILC